MELCPHPGESCRRRAGNRGLTELAAASRKKIYRPSAGMNEALTEKISVRALIIIQM